MLVTRKSRHMERRRSTANTASQSKVLITANMELKHARPSSIWHQRVHHATFPLTCTGVKREPNLKSSRRLIMKLCSTPSHLLMLLRLLMRNVRSTSLSLPPLLITTSHRLHRHQLTFISLLHLHHIITSLHHLL